MIQFTIIKLSVDLVYQTFCVNFTLNPIEIPGVQTNAILPNIITIVGYWLIIID